MKYFLLMWVSGIVAAMAAFYLIDALTGNYALALVGDCVVAIATPILISRSL